MLKIHKNVPLQRWKVITLPDGYQTICYNLDGSNIYDVPIWELANPQGLARWMTNLRRKNWFQQTEKQFWHAMREANPPTIAAISESHDDEP
jgi:hypothetical protein